MSEPADSPREYLLKLLNQGESFSRCAKDIAGSPADVAEALRELVQQGRLSEEPIRLCSSCRKHLDPGPPVPDACACGAYFACPHCGHRFALGDMGSTLCPHSECQRPVRNIAAVLEEVHYRPREVKKIRRVDWVMVLHGMNTLGSWQEDLSWLISRTHGHMVPVAIYKYGIVRPGVLLRCRQGQLVDGLIARLKSFQSQMVHAEYRQPPDVIAHSFGTWMLGHALLEEPSLKVGRVVLTGCILRPDFPWQRLIDGGQVEAVLNHFGTKDIWAALAQYLIPDSGPAGRRGFDTSSEKVFEVEEPGFKHSQFFRTHDGTLDNQFKEVWEPFLTFNTSAIPGSLKTVSTRAAWKPPIWPLRATLPRFLALLVVMLLLVLLGSTVVLAAWKVRDFAEPGVLLGGALLAGAALWASYWRIRKQEKRELAESEKATQRASTPDL